MDKHSQKSYNGIDLLKFLCSFLVCMIHIAPIQGIELKYSGYINYILQHGICRIAVPFFFCASGFLLFNKIDIKHIDTNRIKTYSFKNLRLLGLWITLLFLGSTVQLWYLGGVVIATVLSFFILRKSKSIKRLLVVGLCLYIIGLLFDSYSGFVIAFSNKLSINIISDMVHFLNNDLSRTFRLGYFSSLLFFALGIWFSKQQKSINTFVSWIGLLGSIVFVTIEALFVKHYSSPLDHNMYFSLVPATIFLFNIAKDIKLNDSCMFKKIRVLGVLIFFLHLFVSAILDLLFSLLKTNFGLNLLFLNLLLTIIITTLIAMFIMKMTNKKRYNWLKYLYA